MLEAVGHTVVGLHRSRYAGLTADDLAPGKARDLSSEEVNALRALVR
jgi:16S rRNA U516 pseudouridylate synthase RsuA-like enzyme